MLRRAAALAGTAFLVLSVLPESLWSQEKPFQLSFIGPTLQIVDDDADVKGIRLNILYGVNRNVSGLDLGLINRTTGEMSGAEFGAVNLVDGGFSGWQAGIVNVVHGPFTGVQWSGISLVNLVETGEGAQIAWGYNGAQRLSGFQLALLNIADDLYGLQVGLINIIRSKDRFPVLPLVNWKFDE